MSISSRTVRTSRAQLGASILSLVAVLTLSPANVVLAQGMKNGIGVRFPLRSASNGAVNE
jgi:hypothetical protein